MTLRLPRSAPLPYTTCFRSLAGRIVVFGTSPGHVREERQNALPYTRQERSPEFEDMVDRLHAILTATLLPEPAATAPQRDRKSTRLNSSHGYISYAVFCFTA